MKQREIKIADDDIIKLYNDGKTLNETAVILNATTVTIWRKAKQLNLKWKDLPKKYNGKIELSEILAGKYPSYQTFKLHNRLLNEGIKENKCEICGISSWMDKPIQLQLDHIDGNPHNHKLENLRLLCPNCHSQTKTYCGKNK